MGLREFGGGTGAESDRRRTPGGGLALVVTAAVTWGTTGATMVLMRRRSPLGPVAVGFLRVLVAAPFLLALAYLSGDFAGAAPRLRPHLPRLALVGAAQAGYQLAYFGAVPRIGVAATALLAICTSPLLIAALAPWVLGERMTARVAAAMGAGIAGTACLMCGRFTLASTSTRSALTGAGLALGAALLLGAVTLLCLGDRAGP